MVILSTILTKPTIGILGTHISFKNKRHNVHQTTETKKAKIREHTLTTRVFYTRDDNWITWLDVALIYIFLLIYNIIIHYTII